jgi:hypothetical protein
MLGCDSFRGGFFHPPVVVVVVVVEEGDEVVADSIVSETGRLAFEFELAVEWAEGIFHAPRPGLSFADSVRRRARGACGSGAGAGASSLGETKELALLLLLLLLRSFARPDEAFVVVTPSVVCARSRGDRHPSLDRCSD